MDRQGLILIFFTFLFVCSIRRTTRSVLRLTYQRWLHCTVTVMCGRYQVTLARLSSFSHRNNPVVVEEQCWSWSSTPTSTITWRMHPVPVCPVLRSRVPLSKTKLPWGEAGGADQRWENGEEIMKNNEECWGVVCWPTTYSYTSQHFT